MEGQEAPDGLEVGGLVLAVALTAAAVTSLVTAWWGVHDGRVALAVAVVAGVGLALVVRRRSSSIPRPSGRAVLLLAVVLVVAASQFFPGFPLAAKNRDPGVYVNHAVAIAREGRAVLEDPVAGTGAEIDVVDRQAVIVTDEGAVAWRKLPYRSFPTDVDDPGHLTPDFFHLWPTTLASAHDLAGRAGLFNLTPLLALGAVGLVFLAARRAFGLVAATAAAGLLAVNELQVWQAKFPTAEALSQFLYAAALLAVVLALSTRWRLAALVGGALVGVGFVARPDGVLVVGMAAIVIAGLWVVGRADGRAAAFVAGLAPPLALGAYQAYGRGSRYAELQEGLPSFGGAVVGLVLLVLFAAALRAGLERGPWRPRRDLDTDRLVQLGGLALVALFAAFLVFAWFRPEILGESYRVDKSGERTRGYDELNLVRLSLFLTPVALVAAVAALVVGVRRRWSAARWALLVPGVVVIPILVWEPRIAPDLMWWGRRYVPMVVPTLLLLVGVAAALLWERPGARQAVVRAVTVVALVAMAGYMLRQSSDLWGHEEFGGSVDVIDELEAVADGEDVVFVWQGGSAQATNFAITPFTWLGLPAIAGPPRPTADGLLALQRALGDRPLFLVADGTEPPPGAADVLVEERRIVTELSEFEHGFAHRPRRARPVPVDLTVWRLTG